METVIYDIINILFLSYHPIQKNILMANPVPTPDPVYERITPGNKLVQINIKQITQSISHRRTGHRFEMQLV